MNGNRLLYSECLRIYEVEASFIESLHEVGLIHVVDQEEERFIEYDDLPDLEQFIRWHYEMLEKVKSLQSEVDQLRHELRFYKSRFQ